MLPDYSMLVEDNPFVDARLSFPDGSIDVSKVLLCGHSKFFADMFLQNKSEQKFELDNISLKDFKAFYNYILQGGAFKISGENVVLLMNSQKHTNVPDIENKINTWIMDQKNIAHLGIVYENSIDISLQIYNDRAKSMINLHYEAMHEFKAFDSFKKESMLNLFNKDFNKNKNQEILVNIVTSWVEFNYSQHKMEWLNLFLEIKFNCVSDCFIKNFMKINTKIYENSDVSQFMFSVLSERIGNLTQTSLFTPKNEVSVFGSNIKHIGFENNTKPSPFGNTINPTIFENNTKSSPFGSNSNPSFFGIETKPTAFGSNSNPNFFVIKNKPTAFGTVPRPFCFENIGHPSIE
uniref:BTB domain-containing protein n=1 Tax=Rhabditophanes sp. KR3021 TaxID=114890 RepID=A0AC35TSE6_9BILA